MDFNYNENQKLIAEMIRSFSEKEITPNIKLWDNNQIFPVNVFKKLHKNGQTIIVITHEEDIANQAERVITIRDDLIESDKLVHENE